MPNKPTPKSNRSNDITAEKDHLGWCLSRARCYVEEERYSEALSSLVSDMSKHPSTSNNAYMTMMLGQTIPKTKADYLKFLDEFN